MSKKGFVDPTAMGESESDGGDAGMGGGGGSMFNPARFTNPNFSSEFLATLPRQLKDRAAALSGLDAKYEALKKALDDKRAALLLNFEKTVAKPAQAERKDIVNGTTDVTDEMVQAGMDDDDHKAEIDVATAASAGGSAAKDNLDDFWLTALKRHVIIEDMISERDQAVLKYVTDVTCTTLEPPARGFTITFEFADNDFFTEKTLNKTFHLKEIFDEVVVERVVGTDISWKSKKQDCTIEIVQKKQKAKIRGKVQHRTVEKEEPVESFFRFFAEGKCDPSGMGGMDAMDDDEDEDEIDNDETNNLGLAHVLKDKIIPYAVQWYIGAAGDGSSDLDDDDFGDEEGEEEEEEDDDDDDMPQMPMRGGRGGGGGGGRGGRGGGGGGGGNPWGDKSGKQPPAPPAAGKDCKQQ